MEEKKYRLTTNTKKICGHTVYQIQALKTFADVDEGELGGYVETEGNLSHNFECWVYDNSIVMGKARVEGEATIAGESLVIGNSYVSGNAYVHDSVIRDNAVMLDDSAIFSSIICDNAMMKGYAQAIGNAIIGKGCILSGHSLVDGHGMHITDLVLKEREEVKNERGVEKYGGKVG